MAFQNEVAVPFEALHAEHSASSASLKSLTSVVLSAQQFAASHPILEFPNESYFVLGEPATANGVSRPIRNEIFERDPKVFASLWSEVTSKLPSGTADEKETTRAVYTAMQSFAAAYDLWKRGARKTPGTFFEILIATLLMLRIHEPRQAQVILEVEGESIRIPTDIYFEETNLVVAAKTSTRDRIIQPWAHQLLLDRLAVQLGRPPFRSVLCIVGEVQLGKLDKPNKRPVYPVCVPAQVKLYQQHVAKMSGLYYLDPPQAYLQLSQMGIVPVKPLAQLLNGVLPPVQTASGA